MPAVRVAYLDVAKGIGIVLVIIGHVFSGSIQHGVYIFHMPFFFILIGMTPKALAFSSADLARRIGRYAVTAVTYALIISIVCALAMPSGSVVRRIIDGYSKGYFVVFWFIVTLSISMIGLYFAKSLKPAIKAAVAFLLFALSYIVSTLFKIQLPLGILVSLHAAPLILLGEWIARHLGSKELPWMSVFAGLLICAAGAAFPVLDYNMKEAIYGVPFVSLLLAVTCSLSFIALSQLLTRWHTTEKFFSYLGMNSLAVMFIHQPIHIVLRTALRASDLVIFAATLASVMIFLIVANATPLVIRRCLAVRHGGGCVRASARAEQ